jgi:hypothetical protein
MSIVAEKASKTLKRKEAPSDRDMMFIFFFLKQLKVVVLINNFTG